MIDMIEIKRKPTHHEIYDNMFSIRMNEYESAYKTKQNANTHDAEMPIKLSLCNEMPPGILWNEIIPPGILWNFH